MAVTATLVEQYHRSSDHGVGHAILLAASMTAAVGLTLSFSELIRAFALLIPRRPSPQTPAEIRIPPSRWIVPLFLAAALTALGIQSIRVLGHLRAPIARADLAAISSEVMPRAFAGFHRQNYGEDPTDAFGIAREIARTWSYQSPNGPATLTLCRPVSDWHEPLSCYRNAGWIVSNCSAQPLDEGDVSIWIVEARLSKASTSGEGRLFFTLFDANGNSARRAPTSVSAPTFRRAVNELTLSPASSNGDWLPFTALQLFIEGPANNDEAELTTARSFFVEAFRRLWAHASEEAGSK
jgi:hypothetical protein